MLHSRAEKIIESPKPASEVTKKKRIIIITTHHLIGGTAAIPLLRPSHEKMSTAVTPFK